MLMLVFYDFMNDSVSALYYRGILWANVLGLFMRSENVMLINMVFFFLFTLPFDYFYHIIVIIILLLTLRKYIYIYIYMYKYVLCVYLYIHTYLYIARSPCQYCSCCYLAHTMATGILQHLSWTLLLLFIVLPLTSPHKHTNTHPPSNLTNRLYGLPF